jgi:hypothetical protein
MRSVISQIRKKNSGGPAKPVSARDMEAVEAAVTKSKELGRQRLAAAIETGKHKKTLFER